MKHKQNFVKGISVLVTALLLSGLAAPAAFAAEEAGAASNVNGAFDVVISPPSLGLQVAPGGSVTTDIRVQNHGIATEHVKVSLLKFGARGQDGTPDLKDLQPGDEFANWATFSTPKFDAEPNVWKTVKLTISPPKTAAFGYYYAVVFSRDGAEKQIKTKQANLLGAVASLVLVDVQSPGAVRQAKITEFSTAKNVHEYLPVDFTVRIHNTGNTHIAPRGNIIIYKGGKNVGLIEVNLKKGFVLPNSYRKFVASWNDGTPVYEAKTADGKTVTDKQGRPVTSLNWDKFSASKLRFGKYTAKLVMVYDDGKGDVSTEAKLSFWVIPWKIITGIALVSLLTVAGLYAIVGKPIRQRLKSTNKKF